MVKTVLAVILGECLYGFFQGFFGAIWDDLKTKRQ